MQPTLFEYDKAKQMQNVPPNLRPNLRREKMERAARRLSDEVKSAFEKFLIKFATDHADFITEDATLAYAKTDLPQPPNDFRGVGGIVQKLIRRGILLKTGEYRINAGGSRPMAVYKLK